MKVFISWSGTRSRALAEFLGPWLRQLVQAVDPWISSNIRKGSRSGNEIAGSLESAKVGVICLTPENLKAPWINFEAGALAKSPDIHVCTVLLDLSPRDISDPLDAFQHTELKRDDVLKFVLTLAEIARGEGELKVTDDDLKEIFPAQWERLERKTEEVRRLTVESHGAPRRTNDEVLDEILLRVRSLEQHHQLSEKILRILQSIPVLGGQKGDADSFHPFSALLPDPKSTRTLFSFQPGPITEEIAKTFNLIAKETIERSQEQSADDSQR